LPAGQSCRNLFLYVDLQSTNQASDLNKMRIVHRPFRTNANPEIDRVIQPATAGRGEDDEDRRGGSNGTAVATKTKTKTKRPSLYRVLLLNDDYTPMEFVVHVLMRFFNKSEESAHAIMLHVHRNGVGECGVFTYEVAETKVTQVMDFARKHQHPLQCIMEKQ
jgi:ATP-dependent Clp protease adaptor protein ClpS